MTIPISDVQTLRRQTASLLLYQSVLENDVGKAFLNLLQALLEPHSAESNDRAVLCLCAYGHWFNLMASSNITWQAYLISKVLEADNPFSRQVQQAECGALPEALLAAARQDLRSLQALYSCHWQMSHWVQRAAELPDAPIAWDLPRPSTAVLDTNLSAKFAASDDWATLLEPLAAHYRQVGTGIFAAFRAFRWQSELVGIAYPDPIQLQNLTGYEWQKAALTKNTEALLAGAPALHVLLYGSRGTGKSSLVKSLLGEYGDRGLRLIEVTKTDLQDLPTIADRLRTVPQKFILFVDDLSFEEDEDAFKALKVVLEGNLTARPQNVVVYATSNRRHLIREFFGDRPAPRDADEIHAWDTIQEKLSFSDRFGLTLTFEPADQTTYLDIVRHLAQQSAIALAPEELDQRALQWATRHNGRSGRTARQFIDFLQAELRP
ncbi:MAG: ATP-binding protein [Drouetiella hepatica Uher 2000/2452]|uniref:ATP-binding protein n=1 Tax=Drouetiella hepatica Uher 2000/2452 TaxID=904376 RepID=A0A951UM29_9CYAN|nr:ATP-binding protein [Drouetiella hepatica Uher 2000/2452]